MLLFVDVLAWIYALAGLAALWILLTKPTGVVFFTLLLDAATLFALVSYGNLLRG